MNTNYTLMLVDIRCNSARMLDGDQLSIVLAGRKVWAGADIQLHPHYTHYINFEDGTVHVNGSVEALSAQASNQFCVSLTSLPVVLKLQARTFLGFSETIGRVLIEPVAAQSKIVHQRIVMAGADYCVSYSLMRNY